MEILEIAILFTAGFFAAIINVGAGGGSSLTLPLLIFLGLDSAAANGTNRIAVIFQNLSAVYSFKKENYFDFKLSFKLSLLTLPGSIIGAVAAISVSDETFEVILAVVMILIIISILIPVKGIKENAKVEKVSPAVYLSMFGIGFFGGFIQVGVGFLIMAALHYLLKLKLIYVNMHKVFIVLLFTLPAFLVFVITDNIHWLFGLILAVGNFFGGWIAAKYSVKKGEKFIKPILIAAIIIMAMKLLNIF